MGFTVKDIFASANTENVEGLALSQERKSQTHIGKICDMQTLVNRIIKYDLRLKCMLVRRRCPLPGSRLTVSVLSIFFMRVFSPSNIPFLSENISHKHVAP